MLVNIARERWCVVLDNTKILCGQAREYHFNDLTNIKDAAVKTYLSEAKAKASFLRSWRDGDKLIADGRIKFIKVVESFVQGASNED